MSTLKDKEYRKLAENFQRTLKEAKDVIYKPGDYILYTKKDSGYGAEPTNIYVKLTRDIDKRSALYEILTNDSMPYPSTPEDMKLNIEYEMDQYWLKPLKKEDEPIHIKI